MVAQTFTINTGTSYPHIIIFKSIQELRLSTCVVEPSVAASARRRARMHSSYVAKVTAVEGADLRQLGRMPLYSPRAPSRAHMPCRHAGNDVTASAVTGAPYCAARFNPATYSKLHMLFLTFSYGGCCQSAVTRGIENSA
jgi:hypothetical protein